MSRNCAWESFAVLVEHASVAMNTTLKVVPQHICWMLPTKVFQNHIHVIMWRPIDEVKQFLCSLYRDSYGMQSANVARDRNHWATINRIVCIFNCLFRAVLAYTQIKERRRKYLVFHYFIKHNLCVNVYVVFKYIRMFSLCFLFCNQLVYMLHANFIRNDRVFVGHAFHKNHIEPDIVQYVSTKQRSLGGLVLC